MLETDVISCPICLSVPVAARITKCGHIFCYACILRYISVNEENKPWCRCPLCGDIAYSKDLRALRVSHIAALKEDGLMQMRLMKRPNVSNWRYLLSAESTNNNA